MGRFKNNVVTKGAMVCLALSAGVATTANATVTRQAGANRYETSDKILNLWPTGSTTAILAAGANHNVDALTVAPLAKQLNAPIILVDPTSSIDSIVNKFLDYETVYIANGSGVISESIKKALEVEGIEVIRLGGANRYATAYNIAKELGTTDTIVVANGDDSHLVDSLSIASIAAAKGMPIFLTDGNSLDSASKAYINELQASKVYVLGGPALVKDTLMDSLPNAERLFGADRYSTNIAVISKFKNDSAIKTNKIYFAGGEDQNLIDALAAGPLAGLTGSPIVFASPKGLTSDATAYLDLVVTNNTDMQIIGGIGAVSNSVGNALEEIQARKTSIDDTVKVNNITDINNISNIINGTTVDKLGLATTVDVVLSDGKIDKANITWDTSKYITTQAGDQVISGILSVPAGKTWTLKDTQKSVSVKVTVNVATLGVTSVSAITAKSLKVTFSLPVDKTKATFAVSKSGVNLNVSTTTFSTDMMSATIELSAKLNKGDYIVNVLGLLGGTISGTTTVTDERVSTVEILSSLAIVNTTINPTTATVSYKVTNQYGEDITKTTALRTNSDTNISLNNGIATITLTSGAKIGDVIPFTLINLESAITSNKILTLSAASATSQITIGGLYNKDNKVLNEDTDLSVDNFYILLNVKNQYSTDITNAILAATGLIKTQTNTTVVNTEGIGNALTLTQLTIDGKLQLGLKLTGPIKAGESQIILISTATGATTTTKVVVAESTRTDVVNLVQPTLAVANEDLYIPAAVYDKNGNLITDIKILNSTTKGVAISMNAVISNAFVIKDGGVYVKIPKEKVSGSAVSIVAQSANFKTAILTITLRNAATATLIRGLKTTVSTTMLASAIKTIDASDLVIEDQYGRVMDSDVVKSSLTGGRKIIVKDIDTTTNIVASDQTAITSGTLDKLTAGIVAGTERFQFVLHDGVSEIASSTADITFRVTDGTEYKSYTVDSIGTVYDEVGAGKINNIAYDKAVKVYGVLNDGSKVQLKVGTDFTVTSINSNIDTDVVDGVLNVSKSLSYATDKDTMVVPIIVTINANGQQFAQDVTFSKIAPIVNAIKIVKDNALDAIAVDTVAYDVSVAVNFDVNDLTVGSSGTYNIIATDQYGVAVKAIPGGLIVFADTTTVSAPKLTITPTKGSIIITGNGLASALVDGTSVAPEEEFTITITYIGGKTATAKVIAE